MQWFKFSPITFPSVSYRSMAYLATVLTGLASLCAQVVWQKYLTILVGSDTLSISLVIAVFLLGLAVGYYVFGKITEKPWTRHRLLKVYGFLELVTALYISVFYIYFEPLKSLSFHSPPHLLMDVFVSFLALFLPTFLMGASLPVLTATLPGKHEEINPTHVQIYGWNSLGAFLGVLLSGFFLLPLIGLELTLIFSGGINLIASLIFMANNLKGPVLRQKISSLPSRIPNWFYIFFGFACGAIVISFELLFVRLLNLSGGPGVYNFPIILSLFVGGLALGSLTVKSHKISTSFFIRQILISLVLLGLTYVFSPYWSIWISHIRVSLLSIPSNYFVFKVFLYLFSALALFPAIFFMGRLLPLCYALLKKDERTFGSICGFLYFSNTLGTVFGTIGIGYLAFYIFDLDDLFKINLVFLSALALFSALYEKRLWAGGLAFILAISFLLLPGWDRSGHELGYFRIRSPMNFHFKKLFSLPSNHQSSVLYFNDGPNVSVTLLGRKNEKTRPELKALFPSSEYSGASYVVNGKAIADTVGDFSTMFLLAGLGYLYAPERAEGLSSAVIGLGTGGTAGVLAHLEDSRDVTVLEIAPEVVDNVRREPSYSFGLLENPKAKVIAQDGFKYFTKTRKKFDLIVSEPSNPWVIGVENVFSLEFYELVKNSLAEDGVLVQWAQLYSIDIDTLRIMIDTLNKVFPHARLYRIGGQDLAIVASLSPLPQSFLEKRFFNSFLQPYFKALGFHHLEDIDMIQIFSEKMMSKIAKTNQLGPHTLTLPKLAYRGDKTFFLGSIMTPENLAPNYLFETGKKSRVFKKYSGFSDKKLKETCIPEVGFFCNILNRAIQNKTAFENKKDKASFRLNSYVFLRSHGLIEHSASFLKELREDIVENKIQSDSLIHIYLNHILSQKLYEQARKDLALFQEKDILKEDSKKRMMDYIETVKKEQSL